MRNATLWLITLCALLLPGADRAQTPIAREWGLVSAAARGDFGPVTMKVGDLPENAMAVELTLANLLGLQDLYTGVYANTHVGGALQRQAAYLACYWTTDKLVEWGSVQYVVAYKADPTLVPPTTPPDPSLSRPGQGSDVTLRLRLIEVNQIATMTPRPDFTKAGWVKLIADLAAPEPEGDRRDIAVANIKQIAVAALMYSTDNDDLLPNAHSAGQAKAAIMPYIKNLSVFISQNPNRGQILYNVNLAGVSTDKGTRPLLTPLFYDSVAWPDGGRPVAFLDGHATYVTADAWPQVAAELRRKYKRPPPVPATKTGKKKR
ncbi:MAG: hypothetical protein ACYC96_10435 [Fimbriimonadaceae bacterium]